MPGEHAFNYAVSAGSMLQPDEIEAYFELVAETIKAHTLEGARYLGRAIDGAFRKWSAGEVREHYAPEQVAAVFQTAERAINTSDLANILRRAVADSDYICFHGGTEILAAEILAGGGVRMSMARVQNVEEAIHPVAANCLWAGRLQIDHTAGLHEDGPWLFRYKASATVKLPCAPARAPPSTTIILGAYGDVVNFSAGEFYLSWYPTFMLGHTNALDGRALRSLPKARDLDAMARAGIEAIAAYIPGARAFARADASLAVGGGVIFARGATDISDPASGLHKRSAIGVRQNGCYLSIDTGKYCTAPMFAIEAADAITNILGARP